jgi:hypothetical protein
MMKEPNDLHRIRRQVDMFFDQALSKEDERSLLERVKSDPAYHRVFTQEQHMRESLKKNVHRPGVTPDLIQAIKDNIRMT